ncbi:hypothetical protein [Streptomyces sp. NPDC050988]|uniref:hypothetical protein n=1 Tax=Streptomyces sp. NPDC050988 TaxID=3365637 RepID=UPI0037B1DD51
MMFVSRRKYDDLQARYQNLGQDHEQLKTELKNSRGATLRLAGNYTQLLETGEPMPMFSRPSKVQERVINLERRLARIVRACRRYRAELVDERAVLAKTVDNFEAFVEVSGGVSVDVLEERRLRRLAEQAHRGLDEQMRTLQAANEAMAAELRDHAERAGGDA